VSKIVGGDRGHVSSLQDIGCRIGVKRHTLGVSVLSARLRHPRAAASEVADLAGIGTKLDSNEVAVEGITLDHSGFEIRWPSSNRRLKDSFVLGHR
jgi:hypothetical protein